MSAHTPGPWHEGSHRTVESQSGTICEVYSHMGIAEADANQKLIAAAPRMLSVLRELVRYAPGEYFDDPRSDHEIDHQEACAFDAARSAIGCAAGDWEFVEQAADRLDQQTMTICELRQQCGALLTEIKAAHQIIRNALQIMTPAQKLAWGEANARAGVEGEGVTRANEREAVITKATGGESHA